MNDTPLTLDQQIADGLLKLVYRLVRCYADNSPDEMVLETNSKTLAELGLTQHTKMTSTNDRYWYEVHETMLFTPSMA
jgi:hypothetical protein